MKTTFYIAVRALLNNKSRSFLTMLGVIIGVGSVVLLTSIGTGLQSYVEDQFASLGSNILYIVPGNPFGENGGFSGQESVIESTKPVLKERYLDLILRNNRDLLKNGAISAVNVGETKYRETTKKTTIIGATASYHEIQNFNAATGEWFTELDDDKKARVVLLGEKIAEELFGDVDPVHKEIKIEGKSYEVLGVLEEKGGGFGGPSFDNYIYVPLHTLFSDFNFELIDNILVEVRSKDEISQAKKAVEKTLEKELDEDEFSVFDQTQILDTINQILGVLTISLGGIAAISLVVGGIGIMNIMLVSVTERTREIGLRKALGATPNTILAQFLIEAALLSVFGGLIGLGIAYLGSLALQIYFPVKVTWEAVTLAFGVSTVVGLVFGAAPAKRAADLSPIEALRYE